MSASTLTSDSYLEHLIRKDIVSLDFLCHELRHMRQDLTAFLEDYYSKVGSYIASLESTRLSDAYDVSSPAAVTRPAVRPDAPTPLPSSSPLSTDSAIDQELRSIYLFLVKKYHPDSAPNGGDTQLLTVINHAYEQQHLGSLWKILFEQEWREISGLPLGMRLKLLRHYRERLQHTITVMERKMCRLHASPEYLLFQRVFTARLRGEDLLSQIVARFQEETSRCARLLEYRRFRHQLMQEAC